MTALAPERAPAPDLAPAGARPTRPALAVVPETPAPRPTAAVRAVIEILASSSGLIPRWALADILEGDIATCDDRARKLVERARRVLGPDSIENVWGKGYRLTEVGRAVWSRAAPAKSR